MNLELIRQWSAKPLWSLMHGMEFNCNVPRSFDRGSLDIGVYSNIDVFLDG